MKIAKETDIDNLKKSWKEQDSFHTKYSKNELVGMLNKRSSNNIKYIVIISAIEFLLLMVSLFITATDHEVLQNLDFQNQEIYIRNNKISRLLIYINMVISLGFVIYFYKSYKKIKVYNSIKQLINNILNFRKSVNWFIIINIILGLSTLFLTGFYDFISGFERADIENNQDFINFDEISYSLTSSEHIFYFIIICFVVILVIIIYYLFIYGLILRKLKRNLNELQKIEDRY